VRYPFIFGTKACWCFYHAKGLLSNATTIIGLDLAWSARNRSGAAAMRGTAAGGTLLGPPELLDDDALLLAFVQRHAPAGPAIVAVDAPLRVPNQTGRRPAEAALAAAFRAYEAGPLPANRQLLARAGTVRGEDLVARLGELGFSYSDHIAASETRRVVVEIFPHPAMVAIFGLARTLKYKAKQGRTRATQLAAWREYQAHLRALAQADPPLLGDLTSLLETDLASLGPRALKGYEDRVDALFCAYIGLYAYRWGAARCKAFGSLEGGSIFTPVPDLQR
jgi:predicted RNase H-like nuclease